MKAPCGQEPSSRVIAWQDNDLQMSQVRSTSFGCFAIMVRQPNGDSLATIDVMIRQTLGKVRHRHNLEFPIDCREFLSRR